MYFKEYCFVRFKTCFSMDRSRRTLLQRLFSTFAEGWPGFGLLLQRVATSAVLFYFAGTHLLETSSLAPSLPHSIAALAGVLLLFGLWTPVAGAVDRDCRGLDIAVRWSGDPLTALMIVSLGASVAMIGPGVWSIDAQLYGGKRIEAFKSNKSQDSSKGMILPSPGSTSQSPHHVSRPRVSDLTL